MTDLFSLFALIALDGLTFDDTGADLNIIRFQTYNDKKFSFLYSKSISVCGPRKNRYENSMSKANM